MTTTIERAVDEFGTMVLAAGSAKVYVYEVWKSYSLVAEAGGVTMRVFCGRSYKTEAGAVKAAGKWLVGRISDD